MKSFDQSRTTTDRPALRQRVAARLKTGRERLRAVLHPYAGRKLTRALRAENVARLALSWPDGVRAMEFEKLVARIDTGPIHRGGRIDILDGGTDATLAVQTAIEEAQNEILLETYILKDDETGRALLALLVKAVARGVKVRVLADAAGSWSTRKKYWEQMKTSGIEARLYHPLMAHILDLLHRDHRKIIVVDRRVAFTGGMNIGNENSAAHQEIGERVWRDTHVRLEGSSAWEMAVIFNEGWVRAGGEPLRLPVHTPMATSGPRTLIMDCRSGRGHAETAAVLAATMAAARKRLWITNSYFAPPRGLLSRLCAAARRGVDVRLLLPGRSDLPLVRRAGHGFYAGLLASGVRIFEYQPAILHAKTLLADDRASMIGSSNLDYRSAYFNSECNVLILDPETAENMAKIFTQDLANAVEITPAAWSRRSVLKKWGDAVARAASPLL